MGENYYHMYSRYICVALAALAVAACATDIPPAMESEIDLEGVWAEAQAEVLVQQKSGKSDSACQEVADDAKEEVTDSCNAAQKLVNDLPRGPHCCKKGVSLVTAAQKKIDDAKKNKNDCQDKLTKLYNVRVTFSNVKYSELRDGRCHKSFFSGSSYRKAKDDINKQKKKCSKIDGEIKAYKDGLQLAKRNRYKARETCRSRTRTNMSNMVRKAKKICDTKKNQKAWTRAHHMICVLKKSTLAGCKVPGFPKITAAKMDMTKCFAYRKKNTFTMTTHCNHARGGQLQYLDRQNLQCGNNAALERFHFSGSGCGNLMRYRARCAKSTSDNGFANGFSRTWTKYTPCRHAYHSDIQYLDRQHVHCGAGNVLQGFYFATNGCHGRKMRYKYRCATPRAQMGQTVTRYTPCNGADGKRIEWLDRHAPDCGGSPMQSFYFARNGCGGHNMRYKYTCTTPGKAQKA